VDESGGSAIKDTRIGGEGLCGGVSYQIALAAKISWEE
jgi:hypothetical protein